MLLIFIPDVILIFVNVILFTINFSDSKVILVLRVFFIFHHDFSFTIVVVSLLATKPFGRTNHWRPASSRPGTHRCRTRFEAIGIIGTQILGVLILFAASRTLTKVRRSGLVSQEILHIWPHGRVQDAIARTDFGRNFWDHVFSRRRSEI